MHSKSDLSIFITLTFMLILAACSYNPFNENNHLTGNPIGALAGGGIGAGTAAALGVTQKPQLVAAGVAGAGVGYYLTTLRFASGGIIQAGGQVYQMGDYVTIELPTDQLFEPNTAEFLPQAEPALKSTAMVLQRFPDHNIMISGNTSGFGASRWEQKLSEDRARQVAGYLWTQGISELQYRSMRMRRLSYVGYGNYFPHSTDLTNEGVRRNSRIQITVYPTKDQLLISKRAAVFSNIGGGNDPQEFYGAEHAASAFSTGERLSETGFVQPDFPNDLSEGPASLSIVD